MYVLVVDDETDIEPMFRQKFRKEIKTKKIDFYFAFSAAESLAYLESPTVRENLRLVLSDINMPDMNGLEMLREIKKKYPQLAVFILSAYNDEKNKQTAQTYGANAFLNKPVDFAALKEAIFNLLERSPA
ncbi:MAG: response regulator [Cyanobacteria bacterium SBLK]|nr:response regulator [Cyanobacteria bacterium SBLK]